MANKKISELPASGALTGAELVELVQGGINKQTTTQDIADLGAGGGGTVESVTGDGVDNTDPDNPVLSYPTPGDIGAEVAGAAAAVAGNLAAHIADATDAHAGSAITNTPAGSIAATTVQGAINELDTEKQPVDADLTAIAGLSPSNDDILQRKAGAWTNRTIAQYKADLLNSIVWTLVIPYTDETSPITAAPTKKTFPWPYDNCTIVGVTVMLGTVQTSGAAFQVDINKNGTTILSTKITVDNTESTSATAATPPVISVASAAKLDKFTVDQDQVGDNTAKAGTLLIDYTRIF